MKYHLRHDLACPEGLRDRHHVARVPDDEVSEAAAFGVVADQFTSTDFKRES